jgi:hypothetical protein
MAPAKITGAEMLDEARAMLVEGTTEEVVPVESTCVDTEIRADDARGTVAFHPV